MAAGQAEKGPPEARALRGGSWNNTTDNLRCAAQEQVSAFTAEHYRIKLHHKHCYIYPARVGRHFLGQKVFRTHRLLAAVNVRSFKTRLRGWQESAPENLEQRLASWQGHAEQADTFRLRAALGLG